MLETNRWIQPFFGPAWKSAVVRGACIFSVVATLFGCAIPGQLSADDGAMRKFNGLEYYENESSAKQQMRVYSFRGTLAIPEVGFVQYYRPARGSDSPLLLGCLPGQTIVTDELDVADADLDNIQKVPEKMQELQLLMVQRARLVGELRNNKTSDEARAELKKELQELDKSDGKIEQVREFLRSTVTQKGVFTIRGVLANAANGGIDGVSALSFGGSVDSSDSLVVIGGGLRMSRLVLSDIIPEKYTKVPVQKDEETAYWNTATTLIKLKGWTSVRASDLNAALGMSVRPASLAYDNLENLKALELNLGFAATTSLAASSRPAGGIYTTSSSDAFCDRGGRVVPDTYFGTSFGTSNGWKPFSAVLTELKFLHLASKHVRSQ